MSNKLYSKKHLLQALKDAGLPYSYKSLLAMEKKGIIPSANNAVGLGNTNAWRLYTKEEIEGIVERVRQHKEEIEKDEIE